MEKIHNHSKRRRKQKALWKIWRNPQKRDEVIRAVMASETPLKENGPSA